MPERTVHQVLPSFSDADAIGTQVSVVRRFLLEKGYASTIYADSIYDTAKSHARPIEDLHGSAGPGDGLIFHFSLGKEAIDSYSSFPGKRVLVYHNITPAEYFDEVNSLMARQCREGREALRRLAGVTDLALGVSEYNRRELEAAGFRKTGVLPIPVDPETVLGPADPSRLRQFSGDAVNVFHVGRFAPNKKVEDLLKVFYFYRKIRPESRLILAGNDCNTESYAFAVREMADALQLKDVFFIGRISNAELAACYRRAHAYLGMSEHEGFCVPVVEAMAAGVPVIALAAGGVPETLGDGGILVKEKRYAEIAELLERVVTDEGLRGRLIEAGRRRASAFSLPRVREELFAHLAGLGL
ncbi:MAG: glycosyltransferase [Nitrospirae bacterium]|nr:glycosyltransferase [Nitrospirota bacterium]